MQCQVCQDQSRVGAPRLFLSAFSLCTLYPYHRLLKFGVDVIDRSLDFPMLVILVLPLPFPITQPLTPTITLLGGLTAGFPHIWNLN